MTNALPTPPPSAARPPRRRLGRLRWVLACALVCEPGLAAGADLDTDDADLDVLFVAPAKPGDAFALSFDVPDGTSAAILLNALPPTASAPAAALPNPADLATGLFLPTPVVPGTHKTWLMGQVPATLAAGVLANAKFTLRIVFFDPQTGAASWAMPLVLGAKPVPMGPPSAPPGDSLGPADPPGSAPASSTNTQAPVAPLGPAGPAAASGSGSASPAPGLVPAGPNTITAPGGAGATSTLAATNFPQLVESNPKTMPGVKNSQSVTLRITHIAPYFLYSGSHDQPTPVQGSGH